MVLQTPNYKEIAKLFIVHYSLLIGLSIINFLIIHILY